MSANTTVGEMLAVNGGQPVRETLLPYGRQAIDDDDIQAVVETLRSDWLTTGPKVEEFEEAFAARAGAKHAVSFSSGTAALHGAAFAAGLGPGDEAITSPLTFAATANCVLYQGATPVFADVSPDTLTLDPEQVAFGVSSDARHRQSASQWHYEMVLLGFNYRLPDIACALGLQQLKKLEANLARRREIAARYTAAFGEIPAILCPAVRAEVNPAWHLYPIRFDLSKLSANRGEIFRALRGENIGVNVHDIPVHLHPHYRDRFGYKGGEFPVAEDAYERLISLPMFHAMRDRDVEDVVRGVTKVVEYFTK